MCNKLFERTAVFFNSETSCLLVTQDLCEMGYHVLNNTSNNISLRTKLFFNKDWVLQCCAEILLFQYLLL